LAWTSRTCRGYRLLSSSIIRAWTGIDGSELSGRIAAAGAEADSYIASRRSRSRSSASS
jgi:hypothetical protein